VIPLSYAQRGLWFLQRFGDAGAAYNVPMAWHLSGAVNATALELALADVTMRHESLRTVFPEVNGEPAPRVVRAAELGPLLDVARVPVADVAAVAGEFTGREFDLRTDVPVRALLLILADSEAVLVLVLHHIASDGWSEEVFCRDLGEAYAARAAGTEPTWAELPVQYADYALWQRELLGAETDPDSVIARQLAFWRETLRDLPQDIRLPTSRRAGHAADAGGCVVTELDEATRLALERLASQASVTMFMVAHAATAVLLARLASAVDLPLGTIVSGREDEVLSDLVGHFTNTLVLRTSLSGNPTFRELLQDVRGVDLAAFGNQEAPFEKVVEVLNPVRSRVESPLFQILFTFHREASDDLQLKGITAARQTYAATPAQFDLEIGFYERRDRSISVQLTYRENLYARPLIEAMTSGLVSVLTMAAERPDTRLADFALLPAGEGDLLGGWNATTTAGGSGAATIHECFARQAELTPDAPAVRSGDTELSYRDLDLWSSELAAQLGHEGIGAETPVAVLMSRSAEFVVALLAVLKAGGAYVPLNELDPRQRQQAIVDASRVQVLITDRQMRRRSLPRCALELTVDPWRRSAGQPRRRSPVPAYPEQLACIMYTSGSTGTPKGVAVTHRSVLNYVADRGFRTDHDRRVLMMAPYSFDVSSSEIWVPLLSGGSVAVAPTSRLEIDLLERLIVADKITMVDLPAGFFDVVARESPRSLATLREVITGGDAVSPEAAGRVLRENPGLVLRHAYGPTEATVSATHFTVPRDPPEEERLPIGGPLDNVQVFVLDPWLRPVPLGFVGELYIAGAGLARGYVGLPDVTAASFVAAPFAGPGTRMYRTGDYARWRSDGQLEFIGRLDHQVKIRGFRVELGEIEAAIDRHPKVDRAVVVARTDAVRGNYLIAYAVAGRDQALDAAELRSFLDQRVPAYMQPSELVTLDSFPLTGNGKIDRSSLPLPERVSGTGQEPRNEKEEALCAIFADLLQVDSVGIDESFFDLGGHSLLAASLISRVRATLQADLGIREIFDAPTVAQLAGRLRDTDGDRPVLAARPRPDGQLDGLLT
jgi:amino acid adenylation domain-containing protein